MRSKKPSALFARHLRLLRHAERYRLTTPEAVRRLFFPTADAAKNALRRLRSEGLLESFPIGGSRCIYRLTRRAALHLGASPKALCGRLGPQALVTRLAILDFCCLAAEPKTLLTMAEFNEAFPNLFIAGLRSYYFLDGDEDQPRRLGHIVVDAGGSVTRLLKKCRRCVVQRSRNPHFRALIASRGFFLAIVTSTEEKARALQDASQRTRVPVPLATHVAADLLHLI